MSGFLTAVLRADLEGIKKNIDGEHNVSMNSCLYMLSCFDNQECIKYIIPLSDPTHNQSEALRMALQCMYPTSVALLLPVSDPKDCEDVLCEIVEETCKNVNDEWLNAISICLRVSPSLAPKAFQLALERDCAAAAHILYPYVPNENLLQIFEDNQTIQNSANQDLRARFKLEAIKCEHEITRQSHTKRL